MPIAGRICLLVFVMVLTLGLMLDRPRPLAIQPASHLPTWSTPISISAPERLPP